MKKNIFSVSIIVSLFICIALSAQIFTKKNDIKKLEKSMMNISESNINLQANIFEDTIEEVDVDDLPKGYIYIIFDSSKCSKEEGMQFISSLDKKKYLGVINDVHFIQMNTTNYEELYSICSEISRNTIIGIASVLQSMFDDTLTNDEVESYKGKSVIYIQYIPSGTEANIEEFIKFASSIKDATCLGKFKNSIFLQFENKNNKELEEICASLSYTDGYINSYILQ